ncbi:MAG: tol-pal system protein YbgF [Deltaproteobacteria bacterium RBG_16_49_23]|nr:MAG: tol-pal system protein YbgF [Deltaproteobacteria bacterium RBG_16_49_23]
MKKGDWKQWGIVLWMVLGVYGCATQGDVRILDKDIQRLDSQLGQVQKEKESIKKEMEAIRAELAAFKKETEINLSSLQAENQKTRADLLLRLETLQSDTRTLSTGVEEYKEFLKTPSREISRVKEDVEVRLRILEERGKTFEERHKSFEERNQSYEERFKGGENRLKDLDAKLTSKLTDLEKSVPAKEPPAEPKAPSTTAGNVYKDAYEAFQKGDLDGARRKFEAFLKQYPNMELSDNAQFWIGETYYLKKDFEKAILEYEKAIVKYPEGDKVSSALLKQGLAFLELGDKTNARNLLKRVTDRYPQTEQAEIAKKKLETIK